jgi:hypothetical protein
VLEVIGEGADPDVEVAAQVADLLCLPGNAFLAPAVGDSTEQRNQCGGRGQDDALLDPGLEQERVLLERRAVRIRPV